MPGKQWDDSDDSSSGSEASSPAAPGPAPLMRRANKFEDEEEGDSDVLDSWDAEDSDAEREKAKKEEEAKAKAAAAKAAAAAAHKSKHERIAEHVSDRARQHAEAEAKAKAARAAPGETDFERRERLRRSEQDADLQHAADLFGQAGLGAAGGQGPRKSAAVLKASAVVIDEKDPTHTVNLAALPLLNPVTKTQFDTMRNTIGPLLAAHSKKGPYVSFVQELVRELVRDLPSEQIKKLNSALTTLANDRLREEKAADKSSKKSKAAKTKTTLAMARPNTVDTDVYDDNAYGDDDFM